VFTGCFENDVMTVVIQFKKADGENRG